MKTSYAFGRSKLPAPIISVDTGGAISGNDETFYFWIKARNRVGYNLPSDSTSLTIPNGSTLTINAATFAIYEYEGWMHSIISVSKIDDYSTSKVIYQQEYYEKDQYTEVIIDDVIINENYILNSPKEYTDLDSFPTSNLINGLRVKILSNNTIYRYVEGGNYPVDNITAIAALTGQWVTVYSKEWYESNTSYNKELLEVLDNEYIKAPLGSLYNNPVPIKYYIINNDGVDFSDGTLELNSYISDKSLQETFYVTVLGYYDLTANVLDTTGIDYVNTTVNSADTTISVSKTLPDGHAYVIEVTPQIIAGNSIAQGTYLTLYPKIIPFKLLGTIEYFGTPVADLAALAALNQSDYKDKQIRYVESVRTIYAFDTESSLEGNGTTVITPAGNPATGRWLASSINIADGTVTANMLHPTALDLITGGIEVNTVKLNSSQTYTIDFDLISTDYLIIQTPVNDGNPTILDITGTLESNSSKMIAVELRQQSGTVEFDVSIKFPGGNIPLLSGDSKVDLIVFSLIKDSDGIIKKRATLAQKDIG